MKFLIKFIGWITVVVVSVTALVFILDGTLLNSKFLSQKAQVAGIYTDLAADLPQALAGSNTDIKNVLSDVITPDYVQTKLDDYLASLEQHYRRGAEAPDLTLGDLGPAIEERGYELTPPLTQLINTPIIKAPTSHGLLDQIYQGVGRLKVIGPLLIAVLAVLLIFMGHAKRTHTIVRVLLESSAAMVLAYVLWLALPGLLTQALSSQTDIKLPAQPILNWLKAVFTGIGTVTLHTAIGFAIGAVVALVADWLLRLSLGHRGSGRSGPGTHPISKFHPPDR